MHTKNGKALPGSRGPPYTGAGQGVGRIPGDRVFDPDGRYVGTGLGEAGKATGGAGVQRGGGSSPGAARSRPGVHAPR